MATTMQRGAFVMLDALGFKGIWDRAEVKSNPGLVLEKMEKYHASSDASIDDYFGQARTEIFSDPQQVIEDVRLNCLSDTVVIGVALKRDFADDANARGMAVMTAATLTAFVTHVAVEDAPRLAMRGCMSFGDYMFSKDGRFILGRAVDEAATYHEQAQAALCWLTPSADSVVTTSLEGVPLPLVNLAEYGVPLKGGETLRTHVVCPFLSSAENRNDQLKGLVMGTFTSGSLDIVIKAQHTRKFLDDVRAQFDAHQNELFRKK